METASDFVPRVHPDVPMRAEEARRALARGRRLNAPTRKIARKVKWGGVAAGVAPLALWGLRLAGVPVPPLEILGPAVGAVAAVAAGYSVRHDAQDVIAPLPSQTQVNIMEQHTIKELAEVIDAGGTLAAKIIEAGQDGYQTTDVAVILVDPDVQQAFLRAAEGAEKIPAEVQDISVREALDLADLSTANARKVLDALDIGVAE